MKRTHIIAIIAMAALLVFFIVTYAMPGSPAWLVFIAAGIGIVAVSGMKKDPPSSGSQGDEPPASPEQPASPPANEASPSPAPGDEPVE